MHFYAVGQPYIPGRTRFAERVDYNFRSGEHELRLFWTSPSVREILAVRSGTAEFALYVDQPLIVLLYRFEGACDWSDQPYSWHLVPEEDRTLPDTTGSVEPHALLHVILVDAATGIIKALRALTWSPAFTAAIHLAIIEQASRPFDPTDYDARMKALYRRFPKTSDLLRASSVRTVGGR